MLKKIKEFMPDDTKRPMGVGYVELKNGTTCKSVWITHRFLLVETRRTFCL